MTLLVTLYCIAEPYLGLLVERFDALAQKRQAAWVAQALLLRPAVYALGLLLFMIFDDHDFQFIYFQF